MAKCVLCGKSTIFEAVSRKMIDSNGQWKTICKSCYQQHAGEQKMLMYDNNENKYFVCNISDCDIYMKCNMCGHIFSYNVIDLDKNKKAIDDARLSGLASMGSALSGSVTGAGVWSNNAENAKNRIINYNQCPKCGSRDLRKITKEEAIEANKKNDIPADSASQLLKYKHLFDNGAITDEEYQILKQKLLNL